MKKVFISNYLHCEGVLKDCEGVFSSVCVELKGTPFSDNLVQRISQFCYHVNVPPYLDPP